PGPAAGLIGFLITVFAAPLAAAPPDVKSSTARDRPRVVFPVDNNQQLTGDYVFLEPAFYEALHRVTENAGSDLPVALLERAHYELPVAATARPSRAGVDELRATFEFHT